MLNGMKVIVERRWPQDCVGHEVYSYLPHRFWRWLHRTVYGRDVPPVMMRWRRIMQDRDPMIYMGHTVICSPRQFQYLKRQFGAAI